MSKELNQINKNNWKVLFSEYTKFTGVKESIAYYKRLRSVSRKLGNTLGGRVEASICSLLQEHPDFHTEEMPPRIDVGFGADTKLTYYKEDIQHSLHVDVTANTDKARESRSLFFSVSGGVENELEDAFKYQTPYFKMSFGIKTRHNNFFYYAKPVVLLVIEDYVPFDDIDSSHIVNIGNIIKSLNELICDHGFPKRASNHVYPNPNKYRDEFKAYLKSINLSDLL